ncbi:MAG: hypothetical protein KJO07_24475 [Deltaproteobacteria bacterium]|nr:hypothetical protein [Deltaproteobacteria bacterium]
MKVLCPLERDKDGSKRTYWMRIGSAFTNRDGSFNVYLDALPTNNKLQIRELDERDLQKSSESAATAATASDGLPF